MEWDAERLVARLRAGGCVAPEEEADELLRTFSAADAPARAAALTRRLAGEPLAWIVGSVELDGLRLHVAPGVYVPRRWQTPAIARRAAALLPPGGTAVDLCTGAGTLAALLQRGDPTARVLATDVDPAAVRCARRNGVHALIGDLFDPLPSDLVGTVDVIASVTPYVPTAALALLPSDTMAYEPATALDGGPDGLVLLRRVLLDAPMWLRPEGWLVTELGAHQVDAAVDALDAGGWRDPTTIPDPDGEACGVAAKAPRRR